MNWGGRKVRRHMVFNINPAVLWMFGGVATAGSVGYVVVEQNNLQPPAQVATLDLPKENSDQPELVIKDTPVQKATEPEKQKVETPEEPRLPVFDLLRVEKDGSAVIAGSALPNSVVELLDGETVIATTKTGSGGDFAIVLDTPLSPGPHELIIKSTQKGKEPVYSVEAGIINVPDKDDDLIAMVTKPGAPSRIIQKPEPKPAKAVEEKQPVEVGVAAPKPETSNVADPVQSASVEPEVEPQTKTIADKVTNKVEETEAVQPVEPVAVAKVEAPVAAPEKVELVPEQVEEPEVKVASVPKSEPASEPSKPVEPKVEVAAPTETPKEPAPLAEPFFPVLIEAAEVEGSNVFIAGSGKPDSVVNLYMDGKYVGSAKVGPEGGFLFEGTGGLKPGRYAVRADMLIGGTTQVAARAEVSLLHRPEEVPQKVAEGPKPEPVAKAEPVAKKQPVAEVEPKAVAELKLPATQEPTIKVPAVKAPEPTVEAAKTPEPQTPSEPKGKVAPIAKIEPVDPVVEQAVPSLQAKPEVNEVTSVAKPEPEPVIAAVETPKVPEEKAPEPVQVAEPKAEQKAADDLVVSKAPEPIETEPVVAQPKEIVTGSSVIIRRGDNLWRVSRRKWGQGIRYTVIFDANRDQIRNPHWIYPGQVFKIPEVAENDEKLNDG